MRLNTLSDHLVLSSDKLALNRGGRPKEAKGLNQNGYGVQNCFAIACCSVIDETIFFFMSVCIPARDVSIAVMCSRFLLVTKMQTLVSNVISFTNCTHVRAHLRS